MGVPDQPQVMETQCLWDLKQMFHDNYYGKYYSWGCIIIKDSFRHLTADGAPHVPPSGFKRPRIRTIQEQTRVA